MNIFAGTHGVGFEHGAHCHSGPVLSLKPFWLDEKEGKAQGTALAGHLVEVSQVRNVELGRRVRPCWYVYLHLPSINRYLFAATIARLRIRKGYELRAYSWVVIIHRPLAASAVPSIGRYAHLWRNRRRSVVHVHGRNLLGGLLLGNVGVTWAANRYGYVVPRK